MFQCVCVVCIVLRRHCITAKTNLCDWIIDLESFLPSLLQQGSVEARSLCTKQEPESAQRHGATVNTKRCKGGGEVKSG